MRSELPIIKKFSRFLIDKKILIFLILIEELVIIKLGIVGYRDFNIEFITFAKKFNWRGTPPSSFINNKNK